LGDVATRGVTSPSDYKEVAHFTVTRPGGAQLEPRFADRTILRDEPWHSVLRAIQSGNCDQGILRWARSACVWLRVARQTLVGVESGAEPVVRAFGHDLDISEPRLPILEERSFVCSETLQRSAGTRRATAHAWVYWS
jgi:hypothetical protein